MDEAVPARGGHAAGTSGAAADTFGPPGSAIASSDAAGSTDGARRSGDRVVVVFGGGRLFGQERANLEVIDAVVAAGASVHLIVSKNFYSRNTLKAVRKRGYPHSVGMFLYLRRSELSVRHLWRNVVAFVRDSRNLSRQIKAIDATLVYTFNVSHLTTLLPALLATRTRVVFRAGDVPPQNNVVLRAAWRIVRRRVNLFVGNSVFVARRLAALGVPGERLAVIYSRPPSRGGDLPAPAVLEAIPSGAPVVAYLGQVAEHKGVGVLVEAFRAVAERQSEAHLLIAGVASDQSSFARELKARVEADPALASRVHFTGFVENVGAVLARARVHCAPSLWEEPLANTVLEAKAAGVPSIVFASGGLPEVVADGEEGRVVRGKTAEALAEAIEPYLSDAGRAAREGEAARASLARIGADRFAQNWTATLAGHPPASALALGRAAAAEAERSPPSGS